METVEVFSKIRSFQKPAFDEFILRFPEAPYYSVSENEVKILQAG
ncbi:hypothetical protein QW060_24890 [Myroides ceti]|uniref:Uncharacterized protein n=1 Tax=Paenimyroides ceti TaxID=395087 RepID=A0ABT8D2K1_9FLAO|nr:hypothetical protein [Paenimyroides ceti]MDN3710123.1 hypothetical protein [Paenimyroides ceti]